jgi:DNA-binding PadR family transcriptional regulator
MASHRLNSTAASLLGFLHDGPRTGAALYRTAESRIGDFWSLTRSQVYRELEAMTSARLVRAGSRGPRDARTFTITAAGRAAFRSWAELDPEPETIRFPLLLLVGFGEHVAPARLRAHLATHRATHAARLAAYEAIRDQAIAGAESTSTAADGRSAATDQPSPERRPFAMATLAFGLAYETAVLDWFADVERILPPPTMDDGGA